MPQVHVDGLTINYDVQGDGEPLLLIPYLSADHACYAFQLPAYAEHFSCIALDLPGTGESDKPSGPYSTEIYADQVAGFLGAIGVEQAHIAGVSLGAAVGMHLAARHPDRVRSLSMHSGWDTSDLYLRTIVELWRTVAATLPSEDAFWRARKITQFGAPIPSQASSASPGSSLAQRPQQAAGA